MQACVRRRSRAGAEPRSAPTPARSPQRTAPAAVVGAGALGGWRRAAQVRRSLPRLPAQVVGPLLLPRSATVEAPGQRRRCSRAPSRRGACGGRRSVPLCGTAAAVAAGALPGRRDEALVVPGCGGGCWSGAAAGTKSATTTLSRAPALVWMRVARLEAAVAAVLLGLRAQPEGAVAGTRPPPPRTAKAHRSSNRGARRGRGGEGREADGGWCVCVCVCLADVRVVSRYGVDLL